MISVSPPTWACFGSTTMVTSPTGKGVIVIGGKTSFDVDLKCMYELTRDPNNQFSWALLDQKLAYGRSSHISFILPNHVYEEQFKK